MRDGGGGDDLFRSQDAHERLQLDGADEEPRWLHCVNDVELRVRAIQKMQKKITIFYIDYGIDDVFNSTTWHRKALTNIRMYTRWKSAIHRQIEPNN